MGRLTVITLGSGDESLLTPQAQEELQKAKRLILRTERHPVADYLRAHGIPFESLDALYEQNEDFDSLNRKAAELLSEACASGHVCYAVSDAMGDTVVAALREGQTEIRILPGVTHAERCLSLLKESIGPVCLCPAEDFAAMDYLPSQGLLLTELHSRECAGDCKLKLCQLAGEETPIAFITGSESHTRLKLSRIPLYEMDRQSRYDHLTAVFVPGLPYTRRNRYSLYDYLHVMERLRAPGGCPWDQKQTHESLLPYLLEESQEYIQAVKEDDPDHMMEELGDVLHQVVFHSVIANQCGEFDFSDVTTGICQKMMDRHPYVFAGAAMPDAEEAFRRKEAKKRAERGQSSIAEAMEGISKGLSPLLRAAKVQKQGELGGITADAESCLENIRKQADEKPAALNEEKLGDLLFEAVQACRLAGVDADIALGQATDRYIRRFADTEKGL